MHSIQLEPDSIDDFHILLRYGILGRLVRLMRKMQRTVVALQSTVLAVRAGIRDTRLAANRQLVTISRKQWGLSMTRNVVSAVLALFAILVPLSMAQAPNNATGTFHKLKALAGDWDGKDNAGNTVKTKFELVAGDTAVMETLAMSGMEQMLTLYTVDGDGIALVHYCPTNNQPRMRATPSSTAVKELVFSFQGATNLPDPSIGHEQKLILQFTDADHIIERWTWRKNGKDTEMIYNFTRRQK